MDYTIYDSPDMHNELSKFKNSLKDQMKNFNEFKKIKKTKIYLMAVDDRGANKIKPCVELPEFQGRKDGNIKKKLKSLSSCFEQVKKEIASRPHTDYKKTLYVEAISRALEELRNNNSEGDKIIIFGDLAIMDDECSLERKKCSCQSYKKLNNLKGKISKYKKKDKYFDIDIKQINIPREEGCREERKKIWNTLLKPVRG